MDKLSNQAVCSENLGLPTGLPWDKKRIVGRGSLTRARRAKPADGITGLHRWGRWQPSAASAGRRPAPHESYD